MQNKKTWGKRLALCAVCAVLIPAVIAMLPGSRALAVTSLPHIESLVSSLKATQSNFVILEIVPEPGSGSIGYYIDGQEPCADWTEELAVLSGPTARRSYADALFSRLETLQLLSDTTATPLTSAGDYTESFVWENTDGMTELSLYTPEAEEDVPGTFTEVPGGYKALWQYNLIDENGDGVGEQTGEHVQKISQFSYGGEADYYYDPVFEAINDPDDPDTLPDTPPDHTAVYTGVDDDGDDIVDYYVYEGTVGEGLTLDLAVRYYIVSDTGAPHSGAGDSAPYGAVSDDEWQDVGVGSGYFSRDLTGYEYVGSDGDDSSFDYDPDAGTTWDITYSTVYYSGGYENNHWFLRHVLDRDEDDLDEVSFLVNSITPNAVTPDMVAAADLIVLSAGLDPTGDGRDLTLSFDPDIASETYNDVVDSVAMDIYNRASDSEKGPLILDYRLATSSTAYAANIGKLAQLILTACTAEAAYTPFSGNFSELLSGGSYGGTWTPPADSFDLDKSFVAGSIYSYRPTAALPALATDGFRAPLEGDDAAGFEDVTDEIAYENFLRLQEDPGTDDLLPADLYMAGIIRYIINFGGQRVVQAKTDIRVLELQPGRGTELTPAAVRGWLGGDASGIAEENIEIVTMSTSEFIGKIEDLNETYDMVYIGTDTEGFNLKAGETTDYNDNSMDGLLYANIGDLYYSSIYMAGMLDRDYRSDRTFTSGGRTYKKLDDSSGSVANLFRFSGNDITAAKVQELQDFAAAGYPVIYADELMQESEAETNTINFGVTVSAPAEISGNSFNLTATIDGLPPDVAYSCRWYRDNSNRSWLGTALSCTDLTCPVTATTSERYYYCVVTVDGESARSNSIRVLYTESAVSYTYADVPAAATRGNFTYTVEYHFGWHYYSYEVDGEYTAGIASGDGYLSVPVTRIGGRYCIQSGSWWDDWDYVEVSFQWYKNGTAIPNANQYYFNVSPEVGSSDSYYCVVTAEYAMDGNQWYAVHDVTPSATRTMIVSRSAGGVSTTSYSNYANRATVTTVSHQYLTASDINSGLVDTASYAYEALHTIKGRPNVMTVYEATADTETVVEYLNLSKPEIVWTPDIAAYPVKYELSGGTATSISPTVMDGKNYYYLNYDFTIENATDATPNTTRYDCMLYLDLNSDGRYSNSEEITDTVIRTAGGGLVQQTGGVYALQAGVRYKLTRQMPTDFTGIVPWKLEVVKIGARHIHNSEHGYTRIAPTEAEQIHILQINSNSGDFNLQYQLNSTSGGSASNPFYSPVTNRTYNGIYGKLLADVTDFAVDITTVRANQLDSYGGTPEAILATLDTYDMLIIGFDDMYDKLSENAAEAVVGFIDTEKAVLFTHDTTSFANVPDVYTTNVSIYPYSSVPSFNPTHWGYYFNYILRDSVRLDRYGIRSGMTVGGVPLSDYLEDQTAYTNLTSDEIVALLAADYSIPYTPGSNRAACQTVAESQGFTNYALVRFKDSDYGSWLNATDSSYSSGRETTTISQVNEGQITVYPYDINTADFGGTDPSVTAPGGSYMTVNKTHEQYYQLNLNSDNIVVWYCLSNGSGANPRTSYYASLPNDVINSYYIFNCGNVTYSGVGHENSTVTNEAKLFVNTMIAAYRTVSEAPTVRFTDGGTEDTDLDYQFLTSEYSTGNYVLELDPALANSEATRVYFKVSDPNLNKAKTIAVSFYYTTDDGITEWPENGTGLTAFSSPPAVYTADTLTLANNANLTGGLVYQFNLPAEVLLALGTDGATPVKLFARVTTTIDGKTYEGTDMLELRTVGLFQLR